MGLMSTGGYPTLEEPTQRQPFALNNMTKPMATAQPPQFGPLPNDAGRTAPSGNLGAYNPTARSWTTGQNNFLRDPSTNYNANGTAQTFLQSNQNAGPQALYDNQQSSLWNVLNGRYRTANDPSGAITPMQQGSDPFTNQLMTSGMAPNLTAPVTAATMGKGGGRMLSPVPQGVRAGGNDALRQPYNPSQQSRSFRGGVPAATPSNNRPLDQTSPTGAGAGNRNQSAMPTYSSIQTALQQSPEYQARINDPNQSGIAAPIRLTLPGLGEGTWEYQANGQGTFTPADQRGVPGGYRRVYSRNMSGSDEYASSDDMTMSIDKNDPGVRGAIRGVASTVLPAIGGFVGGFGNLASSAGNALGLSANTMGTIGQGLQIANYARQGLNLYNMARQASSGGKIGQSRG